MSSEPHAVLVAPLPHFGKGDLALAGGKGANLGELLRAGFNVPPGFVITTAAYDLLLQENNLSPRLTRMIDSLGSEEAADSVSQQIQKLFQDLSIPELLADEIIKAYRQLNA